MRSTYPTMAAFLHAYTRTFERLDGPADWKGYTFAYESPDDEATIEVIPHAGRPGRWLVTLNSSHGESTIEGVNELSPSYLPTVIERLRARDAQLARVDHDAELARLREAAAKIEAAQTELRYRARLAVQDRGLKKVDVAEALGVSRPTLDAWLSKA